MAYIPQFSAVFIYANEYSKKSTFPNNWQCVSNTNVYSKNAYSPTLRPKGTQTPTKLHISYIHISLLAEYNPPIFGSIYPIPNYIHPCWQNIIPQLLTAYIQYQYINSNGIYSPIVGSVYPIQMYILKNAHSPTLRPKGTQTPTKLHISLLAEYYPPIVGSIYPIPNYIHPCWQNIIPLLLTAYIQYQYINSNGIYSPIVCSREISFVAIYALLGGSFSAIHNASRGLIRLAQDSHK